MPFVLDTAYAFEYDWFKMQDWDFGSTNSYTIEAIDPARTKYYDIISGMSQMGQAEFARMDIDEAGCQLSGFEKRDFTGIVKDIQAEIAFIDVIQITDAQKALAASLENAPAATIRAKMDSVSNHYPKNFAADKRQVLRYALFITETGWGDVVNHIRYATCSDISELCGENTVKNLIGTKVSTFFCPPQYLYTAPTRRAILTQIPVAKAY